MDNCGRKEGKVRRDERKGKQGGREGEMIHLFICIGAPKAVERFYVHRSLLSMLSSNNCSRQSFRVKKKTGKDTKRGLSK